MLHQLHPMFLLLDHHEQPRTHVREARAHRWAIRRRRLRLRELLRAPMLRIPTGVHHG